MRFYHQAIQTDTEITQVNTDAYATLFPTETFFVGLSQDEEDSTEIDNYFSKLTVTPADWDTLLKVRVSKTSGPTTKYGSITEVAIIDHQGVSRPGTFDPNLNQMRFTFTSSSHYSTIRAIAIPSLNFAAR